MIINLLEGREYIDIFHFRSETQIKKASIHAGEPWRTTSKASFIH